MGLLINHEKEHEKRSVPTLMVDTDLLII